MVEKLIEGGSGVSGQNKKTIVLEGKKLEDCQRLSEITKSGTSGTV